MPGLACAMAARWASEARSLTRCSSSTSRLDLSTRTYARCARSKKRPTPRPPQQKTHNAQCAEGARGKGSRAPRQLASDLNAVLPQKIRGHIRDLFKALEVRQRRPRFPRVAVHTVQRVHRNSLASRRRLVSDVRGVCGDPGGQVLHVEGLVNLVLCGEARGRVNGPHPNRVLLREFGDKERRPSGGYGDDSVAARLDDTKQMRKKALLPKKRLMIFQKRWEHMRSKS